MYRRDRSNTANSHRVRKISLQNDYAFGIISPVSPTSLPVPVPMSRSPSLENTIPCILVRPWQVESRNTSKYAPVEPDIDFGIDPLSEYPSSSPTNSFKYSSSAERFRRWSFSNFQSAFKVTDPSGTEVSSQFTSDDEDFIKSRNLSNGSYSTFRVGKPSHENHYWISDLITSIPEKIRKISSERKPPPNLESSIYYPDEDLKRQMQAFYVY